MSGTRPAKPLLSIYESSFRDAWAGGRGGGLPLTIFLLSHFILTLNWPSAAGQVKPFLPPILLCIAMLIALMQTERIFQEDYEDGSLELWVCSEVPLSVMGLAKVLCHWCVNMVPLALITPFIALGQGWQGVSALAFIPIFLIFSLGLYALGGVAGAISVGQRRNAILMALLIIPLSLPLFVYASAFLLSQNWLILAMLLSTCLFILSTAPFMIAGALRLAVG